MKDVSEETLQYIRERSELMRDLCDATLEYMKSEVSDAPELMHEYIMAIHAVEKYLEQTRDDEEITRLYVAKRDSKTRR